MTAPSSYRLPRTPGLQQPGQDLSWHHGWHMDYHHPGLIVTCHTHIQWSAIVIATLISYITQHFTRQGNVTEHYILTVKSYFVHNDSCTDKAGSAISLGWDSDVTLSGGHAVYTEKWYSSTLIRTTAGYISSASPKHLIISVNKMTTLQKVPIPSARARSQNMRSRAFFSLHPKRIESRLHSSLWHRSHQCLQLQKKKAPGKRIKNTHAEAYPELIWGTFFVVWAFP